MRLAPVGDVSADTVGINATANSYNRLTVSAPSTLLTHQGGDHRLVINKSSAGHTGSLLMQTDWQGRAELGLAGSDDFSFKVSADGSAWQTAMTKGERKFCAVYRKPLRRLRDVPQAARIGFSAAAQRESSSSMVVAPFSIISVGWKTPSLRCWA